MFTYVAFNVHLRTQSPSTITNVLFAADGYLVKPDITNLISKLFLLALILVFISDEESTVTEFFDTLVSFNQEGDILAVRNSC